MCVNDVLSLIIVYFTMYWHLDGDFFFSLSVKMSVRKQTPSDFLKQIIGRPVVVKLNSGVDYRGGGTFIICA